MATGVEGRSGEHVVHVRDVRSLSSPVTTETWLAARLGLVRMATGDAPGLTPDQTALLVGEPLAPDAWHAARVLPFTGSDLRAARLTLQAHALYLLRRAGAVGGDRAAITPGGREAGLGELAEAFGLDLRSGVPARWVLWTEPMDVDAGGTVLWLAGAAPVGVRTVTGPLPIRDARTHVPPGEIAWPIGRCLRFVASRFGHQGDSLQ